MTTKASEEALTPVPEHLLIGPLATEPQVNYLNSLRDGKDLSKLSPEQRAWLADVDFAKIPKKRAGDVIDTLKPLPWAPRDSDSEGKLPEVADGRYAIPKPDGTLMFYSVKKGTYTTFVDVWASDARWPIKAKPEKDRILTAIKNDPDAGPRFGREIGRCYVCGRTLTDELSRQLGIGPVCRDR
jgi:Family of unknown function (DUF6011)